MATPIINTNLDKVVAATGNIADDLSALRPLLRNAIFSACATDKVENAPIASFPDGADNIPVKSLVVDIDPVQSGSGDPSPSNVRPISGWTGAEIMAKGVNLWNEEWEVGSINENGQNYISGNTMRSKNYIPVPLNTQIRIVCGTGNASNIVMYFYDKDKNFIPYTGTGKYNNGYNNAAGLPDLVQNAYYVRFRTSSAYGDTYKHDISINYPSTDTAYHASVGTTHNITWSDEAGTVYGGTLAYLGGDAWRLTKTMENIASYAGETITEPWLSSMDAYEEGATPTTGAQVVYELATPVIYDLTGEELATVLGTNNIFANTGDVTELVYRADTALFVEKKLAE